MLLTAAFFSEIQFRTSPARRPSLDHRTDTLQYGTTQTSAAMLIAAGHVKMEATENHEAIDFLKTIDELEADPDTASLVRDIEQAPRM